MPVCTSAQGCINAEWLPKIVESGVRIRANGSISNSTACNLWVCKPDADNAHSVGFKRHYDSCDSESDNVT